MAKLKVFRTPAGFHDAYVAAPSQKAALAAWGVEANLFARGLAEQVTDPALSAAPLAAPGEVIKVARTMADAPPEPTRRKPAARPGSKARPKPAPKPKPAPEPKPSRTDLDAAEHALANAEKRHAREKAALRREEEALAERRRTLDREHAEERAGLDRARIVAADAYEFAMKRWRSGR